MAYLQCICVVCSYPYLITICFLFLLMKRMRAIYLYPVVFTMWFYTFNCYGLCGLLISLFDYNLFFIYFDETHTCNLFVSCRVLLGDSIPLTVMGCVQFTLYVFTFDVYINSSCIAWVQFVHILICLYFILYLKPKVSLQWISIRFSECR